MSAFYEFFLLQRFSMKGLLGSGKLVGALAMVLVSAGAVLYWGFFSLVSAASRQAGPMAVSIVPLYAAIALLDSFLKTRPSFAVSVPRACVGMTPLQALFSGCAIAGMKGFGFGVAYTLFALPVVHPWLSDPVSMIISSLVIMADYVLARYFIALTVARSRHRRVAVFTAATLTTLSAVVSSLLESPFSIIVSASVFSAFFAALLFAYRWKLSKGDGSSTQADLVVRAGKMAEHGQLAGFPGPVELKIVVRKAFSAPEHVLGYVLSALFAFGSFSVFLYPSSGDEGYSPALGGFVYSLIGISFQAVGANALWSSDATAFFRILPVPFRRVLGTLMPPLMLLFAVPFVPSLIGLFIIDIPFAMILLVDCVAFPLTAYLVSFKTREFGIVAVTVFIIAALMVGILQAVYGLVGHVALAAILFVSYRKAIDAYQMEELRP